MKIFCVPKFTNRKNGITFWLLALLLAACVPACAQLTPQEPDPLERIRDAARSNVQACSATGESLCEQVAPKIVANAQGDSSLAENLRRFLKDENGHNKKASKQAAALGWAAASFLDAGVEAHVEKGPSPTGGAAEQENLVAEFRGREIPDEWVLLGAHLGPREHGPGAVDSSCDAATVIEAARAISLTSVHPRRSIRFVLFSGGTRDETSSWTYVHAHHSELDQARAVIVVWSDCRRVTSYLLNGRPELEPSVREAMKPIESFGAMHFGFGSSLGTDGFDFLLEGVPALTTLSELTTITIDGPAPPRPLLNITDIKRNAALVAVTAFGIAERATPPGPRQSRPEIESLLKTTGLAETMKSNGIWPQWQSGERGRQP